MKKKLLLIVFAVLLSTGSMYSLTGIGIFGDFMGSTTGGGGGGIGLTLKFGNFPVIGLKWMLSQNYANIGISCDYWAINAHLGGILDYYLGVGLYAGLGFGNPFMFNPGLRIPIGLQIWPVEKLELFLEFAPMVTIQASGLGLGYALSGGLRVHF
jgi:hypothetical protein